MIVVRKDRLPGLAVDHPVATGCIAQRVDLIAQARILLLADIRTVGAHGEPLIAFSDSIYSLRVH